MWLHSQTWLQCNELHGAINNCFYNRVIDIIVNIYVIKQPFGIKKLLIIAIMFLNQLWMYSQTCVQRPPLGTKNGGRYRQVVVIRWWSLAQVSLYLAWITAYDIKYFVLQVIWNLTTYQTTIITITAHF